MQPLLDKLVVLANTIIQYSLCLTCIVVPANISDSTPFPRQVGVIANITYVLLAQHLLLLWLH